MDEYPVLVAGAGRGDVLGVHGVAALVVERHATISLHPKARGRFPHTMEAVGHARRGHAWNDALLTLSVRNDAFQAFDAHGCR
jgi:hypothetical protein